MAWTSVGFDGTITEIQWAGLSSLLGNGYVAAGNGDCLVTAVPGARSVSVAAGSLYGNGVLSTNSGAETVAMTTPVNGQWYVIALRRTWATNTAALVAIAGATTTTTTPTAPPTSFPTLNTNVGVLTDQPIAWAWCNSANTTVVVYDIRLKAVKSLPPVVATSAERDAKFMSPTQGLQVWRDDLGTVETYYGLYNSSTNPGGRDTAGWYKTSKVNGLVPIMPTSVTPVSGTASVNSLGTTSFTNVSKIQLNGVFTGYTNYKIVFRQTTGTGQAHELHSRYMTGGTENTTTNYQVTGGESSGSALTVFNQTAQNRARWAFIGNSADTIIEQTVTNPSVARTTASSHLVGSYNGSPWIQIYDNVFYSTTVFDGISIYSNNGALFSGEVIVYGINQ